jgi:signal transduction histidine kinase/DNA-binding response OmpR family regulator/ABC-type amino acid transport substrate-binding protein
MIFAVIAIATAVSGCGQTASPTPPLLTPQSPFASFRDIPGVTAEEILAIEALQREQKTFFYGMTLTTEAFLREEGEVTRHGVGSEYAVGGYAALLCEWFSSLFGIRFEPEVYAWNDLLERLNAGTLDFAGNLIITEERKQTYHMTDAIAERQYKMMRLRDSPALNKIAQERPIRYAFLEGAVHGPNVASVTEPGTYEPVWVGDYTQVYNVLESGHADAFIAEDAMEASFSDYDNMFIEDFLPLIFSPVAMATARTDLEPVISIVTKALRGGAIPYLNYLFNQGYEEYKKHKFFTYLDYEEKKYLQNTVSVPLVAQYFNYPIIFFDERYKKWDGIAMDLLHEVEKLTGFTFDVVNDEHTEMPELIAMLADGRGHIFTDLIFTKEREPYFIWNKNKFMSDQYALLSDINYPNVSLNEIPNKRIALVSSTAHKEMFHIWFPNAINTTDYTNLDDAFLSLEHGEADLLMAAKTKLLYYLNYHESPGFKSNFLFNYSYESAFAFNKDKTVLCSIVDKAISIVNTDVVVEQWVTKTYDYRVQLAEARLPWLIGAAALSLITLALILTLIYRSLNSRKQKEADAKVRETDERAQIMFDVAPFAGCMFDKDFNMIDCNQELVRMFGIPDREFFLNRHAELFPEYQPDGSLSTEVSTRNVNIALEKGYHYFECMHRKLSGDPLPVKSTLVCVKYRGENVIASYFTDLTEQRAMVRLIKQQAEAEAANRAKSSFLATMSHEMRTPMNAIIGMTSIGKSTKDMERKDYALHKIEDAAVHLLSVINDILDISKIEANKLELSPVEFNFERMLQKIVNIINFRMDEKHQKFTVNVDRKIPRFVIGDDHRLSQVILNLLSNAVKFSPEQGQITLNVSLVNEEDGICEIRTEVSDNGIGITPEQQTKLFHAFQQADSGITREYGGSGLGLSISKHIVELMSGAIWVESESGRGSKFIFTVKLERGKKNVASMLSPGIKWENLSILVADDEPAVNVYFKDLFGQLGLKCDTASDGFQACRAIDEHGSYDIYFIDWRMPGMDGIELTRRIKAHDKDRPSVVVMISSADWAVIKDTALDAGVNKYLLKPLFSSAIIDCINECLGLDAVEEEGAETGADGRFTGKRLLVAEDVEINREIILSLLEDSGLSIDCAQNGLEAVEMVAAAPEKYDAVLRDVQMPKMNGLEATRLIRALNTSQRLTTLPIIAMTAHVFKSDIEECLAAGMNDHIGKPIDIEDVIKKLNKYLNKK